MPVYVRYNGWYVYFWTSENNKITGIQTWFKNINDQNSINSGENKGSLSQYFHEFIINSNEYLIDCEIWKDSKYINTCTYEEEYNISKYYSNQWFKYLQNISINYRKPLHLRQIQKVVG